METEHASSIAEVNLKRAWQSCKELEVTRIELIGTPRTHSNDPLSRLRSIHRDRIPPPLRYVNHGFVSVADNHRALEFADHVDRQARLGPVGSEVTEAHHQIHIECCDVIEHGTKRSSVPVDIRDQCNSHPCMMAQLDRISTSYGSCTRTDATNFLAPGTHCHTLFDGDVMAGYCTYGDDAQVPGGDYDTDGIDIGLGVKPERTGAGVGYRFVEAVVDYALVTFDPLQLRVTIAAGNIRALRVWSDIGFSEVSRFATTRDIMGSGEFAILTLTPADHPKRSRFWAVGRFPKRGYPPLP